MALVVSWLAAVVARPPTAVAETGHPQEAVEPVASKTSVEAESVASATAAAARVARWVAAARVARWVAAAQAEEAES